MLEERPTMAARRNPAEWQRLITEQAASQLPTREFCRAQGMALSSFHYWKRRLCSAQSEQPVSRSFVPVTVAPKSDITVHAGAATVTLSSTVQPEWLAAFIKALQV